MNHHQERLFEVDDDLEWLLSGGPPPVREADSGASDPWAELAANTPLPQQRASAAEEQNAAEEDTANQDTEDEDTYDADDEDTEDEDTYDADDEDQYTDEEDEQEEELPDPPGWDDLAPLVFDWSDIWVNGSEYDWHRYAWHSLAQAGLTTFEDDVQRCHVVVRLAALTCIYRAFQARARDLEHPAEWEDCAIDLLGPHPRCAPFSLGQLCERLNLGIVADEGELRDPTTLPEGVKLALIRAVAPEVAKALLHDLCENFTFASLYASAGDNVHFPLSARRYDAAVNADIDAGKMDAWAWVTDGMGLDNY